MTGFFDETPTFILPDHEEIVRVISRTIQGWFPSTSESSSDSLAFPLVHNVLTIRPVADGVYSLFYRPSRPGLEVRR